ncbi:MAG: DUF2283 domain-containing protein [Candidatus Omnitrophica bacterium]|nr:DUF2283 domain-containing protein [Candidatus Omnitrophota bacterium]
MIISYDNLAEAVYIKLKPEAKVSKTIEFAPETFIDLTSDGELVGVEMLNPGNLVLKRLAKKFHRPELNRINTKFKQAVA